MDNTRNSGKSTFIWETHGIHAGTNLDHVKHGVDRLEEVAEEAIARGYPSITCIIHTPRLTGVRYRSERDTDIKFIRGDRAYSEYPELVRTLRERYRGRLEIRFGIELEWQGSALGIPWNGAKVFQCRDADFIVGSVHFSREGIPYDGSAEEARELLEARGGPEEYWLGYLDEMIEMVDRYRDVINVVGHLDLPKLHVPVPECMTDLDRSRHVLARRMRMLLELMSEANLALDLNLAGIRKGCGIYPHAGILARAARLGIPVTIGTDAHSVTELGEGWAGGADAALAAGYSYYVSYSKGIAEKRPLEPNPELDDSFALLNLAVGMLGQRLGKGIRSGLPRYSFGGRYRGLLDTFKDSVSLGDQDALRARQAGKFITLSADPPPGARGSRRYLFSRHKDVPGTLAIIFNTLASEEINVETAYLESFGDGTACAWLTVTAEPAALPNAIEFIRGTAGDRFMELALRHDDSIPSFGRRGIHLVEVDGVELPIPVSERMILTVHDNKPGTLLVLLSALASRNVNVVDLQLGERGSEGFAALGVDGDDDEIRMLLSRLGEGFREASFLRLDLANRFPGQRG